jgi:hypothetical protein
MLAPRYSLDGWKKISSPLGFASLYLLRYPGPPRSTILNINLDNYDIESELVFLVDLSYSGTVKSLVKWTRGSSTWTVTWSEQWAGSNSDVFLTVSHSVMRNCARAQWKLLDSVRLQPSLSGPNQSGEKTGSLKTTELSYVFPANKISNIMRLLPCLVNPWIE